jgi:hypothetical protein
MQARNRTLQTLAGGSLNDNHYSSARGSHLSAVVKGVEQRLRTGMPFGSAVFAISPLHQN